MATTTQSVLNRVSALLSDEEFTRWPSSELLEWINDGQRALARDTTDAYVKRANITAAAGTTQALPSDGIRLIDVVHDVTTGNNIFQSDASIVAAFDPDWRNSSAGTAEVFFYDERQPNQFELYPPQAGGAQIEVLYNAVPPNTTVSGDIAVGDVYVGALIDYVVHRALSKDSEDSASDLGRATAFLRSYLLATGQKAQADALIEPRRS